ncbi:MULTISPECIES: hypothetical protein [unclassified Rickettsia]|uniref:hypothetical protein n=1 Tax=unclassified Rickettsia TaxID=114295 RepID=UPI003133189F
MSVIITTTLENLPEALKVLDQELNTAKASTKSPAPKVREPITTNEARDLYSNALDSTIEATKDIVTIVEDLNKLEELKKQLLEKEDILKVSVMNYMQLHSKLTFNNKCLVTWKSHSRSSFDLTSFKTEYPLMYELFQKESSNRVFRLG